MNSRVLAECGSSRNPVVVVGTATLSPPDPSYYPLIILIILLLIG